MRPCCSRLKHQLPIRGSGAVAASPVFTVRQVMELTEITNLSTVRRGLEGLVAKSSAERVAKINGDENHHEESGGTGNGVEGDGGNGHTNGNGKREQCAGYRVRLPEEVIARRDESGTNTFTRGISGNDRSFERVIQRIVATKNLSRREAQVALCCVEGSDKRGDRFASAGEGTDCEVSLAPCVFKIWREASRGIDFALVVVSGGNAKVIARKRMRLASGLKI